MTDKQIGVHPNTWVFTRNYGQIHISQLVGETVECWNGKEWSKTTFYQTNCPIKVKFITFSQMAKIYCGLDQKWPTVQYYDCKLNKPDPFPMRTEDLKIGTRFFHNMISEPCIHGNKTFNFAYENGFVCGDGTIRVNRAHKCINPDTQIRFYTDDKKVLIPKFYHNLSTDPIQHEYPNSSRSGDKNSTFITLLYNVEKTSKVFRPKFTVPEIWFSINDKMEWFAGYLDADGHYDKKRNVISFNSVNIVFLMRIKRFLNTLGIDARIIKTRDGMYNQLDKYENFEFSGKRIIHQQTRFDIHIPKQGIKILYDLGYNNYAGRVRIPDEFIRNWTPKSKVKASKKFTEVVDIRDSSLSIKTCFGIEPKRHMLVYNGVLSYDGEI